MKMQRRGPGGSSGSRAARLSWRALALATLLVIVAAPRAAAFDLYRVDAAGQFVAVNGTSGTCSSTPRPRPLLLVHGHELGSSGNGGSYQDNFTAASGASFLGALNRTENQDLGIEAYFIQMRQANRSIFEDAQRIGQAIALIQSCQDPASPAGVRVAVIGYSKGTISARVYLRSRQADLSADFPGEVALDPPGANPVSEFVGIAPPNHGLRAVAFLDTELPIRQLNDGVRRTACTSYNEPLATRFMSRLNGEANGQWTGAHETPGNRANGAPVADGTLFVAIYATGDRDLVGGESPDPDNDCNAPPRKQARNRGANAVNLAIDVPAPTGLTQGVDVHRATVKHAEVICRALYTVVNHRAPEGAASVCPAAPDGNPIIPFGTAITLVLDHSGSMGIPACPTCQSKQAVLRDAAEIFLNLWLAVAGPKDRAGITYFRTTVGHYVAPGPGDSLVPVLPDVTPLVTDLQAQVTTSSGLTAMGGGLQAAILQLQGAAGPLATVGPNRNIILFTDGLQNVNPMVQPLGPGLVIADQPGGVDAGVPTLLTEPLNTYGIRIHTIGIGPGVVQPSQAILGSIAIATGGVSRFDVDAAALEQFFTMSLMDALNTSSPQLVAYRRGTLAGDEVVEAFPVTAGVRKVVLKLSWPRGATLDFRVEKDGVDVTAKGRVVGGPFYRIFSIAPPSGGVVAGGEWRLKIRGRPGIPFQAAAIVDDHRRSARARFARRDYRVGDALDVVLELRDGSQAVRGATVTATLLRPIDSVANLLAAYPARTEPAQRFEPLAPAGQRAAAQLLQDERVWARVLPTATSVRLEDDGKGAYRASLPAGTVPGVYTLLFEAAAPTPGGVELRRAGAVSAVVRVGRTSAEQSNVRVVALATTARGREAELVVTPRDASGNYLGPDQSAAVAITVGDGAKSGEVRDLANGTYVMPLVFPEGADPAVTIAIAGEPLLTGRVSTLTPQSDRKRLFWLVGIVSLGWIGVLALILVAWRRLGRYL
jgi:hypothetical protein